MCGAEILDRDPIRYQCGIRQGLCRVESAAHCLSEFCKTSERAKHLDMPMQLM